MGPKTLINLAAWHSSARGEGLSALTVDDELGVLGHGPPARLVGALARVVAVEGALHGLEQQLAGVHVAERVAHGGRVAVRQLLEQLAVQQPAHRLQRLEHAVHFKTTAPRHLLL